MVRAFSAIFIPEELGKRLVSVQKELEKIGVRCKWVERENFHISLGFFGEIDLKGIENIKKEYSEVFQKFGKFDVEVNGMKLIPSENFVRVIALEIKSSVLENIFKILKDEVRVDIKDPHLTLGRVKFISSKKSLIEFARKFTLSYFFEVEEVFIVESKLYREGPKYKKIFSIKLS